MKLAGSPSGCPLKLTAMTIKDINGKQIVITDPDASLKQVEIFLNLIDSNSIFKDLDESVKSYWQDIHKKLQAIQR
jgi:hypothetical protein